VVTESFIETSEEGQIHGHLGGCACRDDIVDEACGEGIELVVSIGELEARITRALAIGASRKAPHLGRDVTHPLNKPSTEWREQTTDGSQRTLRHVLREVRAALELGHDLKHRDEILELVLRKRPRRQSFLDEVDEFFATLVDRLVFVNDTLGAIVILFQ
jgi:hypothetical protein